MTQEDKDLLLKDLCTRLPYGVKYKDAHGDKEILDIWRLNRALNTILYDDKPSLYLRPMSTMTEEEKHKLLKFGAITCLENGEAIDVSCVGFERHADVQDYLNTCHFDYRGLIEKGLALEAPEGMYK